MPHTDQDTEITEGAMGDNSSSNTGHATIGDLSDEDIMIKYCLDNKVKKVAIDELLVRGYDSIEALRLVDFADLGSSKIPIGQRRLIMQIAKALVPSGAPNPSGTTAVGEQQTSASVSTAQPEVTPVRGTTTTPTDLYNQTLLNSLINHQARVLATPVSQASSSAQGASASSVTANVQPSWNDPQIHIASATGKSTSVFLDICDFVPNTVDEETVIGETGDQQIVLKSGSKKPKLESLSLSQWSIANMAILYKLVGDGKLEGPALMDYLSYTTKVYQLVQKYSLASVLLYDREYRKLQGSMGFRWGTDVQHLHTLYLQPRDKPLTAGGTTNIPQKKRPSHTSAPTLRPQRSRDAEICRNFNSEKGCKYTNCRFRHQCIVPGCNDSHPVALHLTKKN